MAIDRKSYMAFRTISEAATLLEVPTHVLRFWETKFESVTPLKRGGGRRYYRPNDISLLYGIKHFLYEKRFSIKKTQALLRKREKKDILNVGKAAFLAKSERQNDSITNNHQANNHQVIRQIYLDRKKYLFIKLTEKVDLMEVSQTQKLKGLLRNIENIQERIKSRLG